MEPVSATAAVVGAGVVEGAAVAGSAAAEGAVTAGTAAGVAAESAGATGMMGGILETGEGVGKTTGETVGQAGEITGEQLAQNVLNDAGKFGLKGELEQLAKGDFGDSAPTISTGPESSGAETAGLQANGVPESIQTQVIEASDTSADGGPADTGNTQTDIPDTEASETFTSPGQEPEVGEASFDRAKWDKAFDRETDPQQERFDRAFRKNAERNEETRSSSEQMNNNESRKPLSEEEIRIRLQIEQLRMLRELIEELSKDDDNIPEDQRKERRSAIGSMAKLTGAFLEELMTPPGESTDNVDTMVEGATDAAAGVMPAGKKTENKNQIPGSDDRKDQPAATQQTQPAAA